MRCSAQQIERYSGRSGWKRSFAKGQCWSAKQQEQHQHLPQQQRLTPELERSGTRSANRQARLEGLARGKQALEQALQDVSAQQQFQT
jgi:hypothetical protein